MDAADITALNDFNEEIVTRTRHSITKASPILRGMCLNCGATTPKPQIYCDTECRLDFEEAERIHQRTYR